jgi:RNA polymerase sigma-70 factor (ECF subfamily)
MSASQPSPGAVLIGGDFVRRLRKHIARAVKLDHECDDVFQEAAARVLARINSGQLQANDVEPYAFRVASNIIIDRHRSNKHQTTEIPEDLECSIAAPDKLHAAKAELAEVMKVIAGMPPLRRKVFISVRVEGKSHKEVSQTLGISQKSIEKHMSRALADLVMARRRLSDDASTVGREQPHAR